MELNWSEFFEENKNYIPAPASLFTEQQHEGMCNTETLISKYFPTISKTNHYELSCRFRDNPRRYQN